MTEHLDKQPPEFRARSLQFIDARISHYVLNGLRLVVAHARMKQEIDGRGSGKVRDFALYGETTDETDEFGLPARYNWAARYHGKAMVFYGHAPVPQAGWLNRTIHIDTRCFSLGRLTALRYPEKELVSVAPRATYAPPVKPLVAVIGSAPSPTSHELDDDLLYMDDVIGERIVTTCLHYNVTVREENGLAALKVVSRFAANPKWFVYLPPTMSPTKATTQGHV